MARWAKQIRKTSGEHGTFVLEETGLCVESDCAEIEKGCCLRYRMIAIPNAAGAIMKVLDGTSPAVASVVHTTTGLAYACVKVYGETNPFAPMQHGGPLQGHAVLQYLIRWQQIWGLS